MALALFAGDGLHNSGLLQDICVQTKYVKFYLHLDIHNVFLMAHRPTGLEVK